jgi:hypothetical protein
MGAPKIYNAAKEHKKLAGAKGSHKEAAWADTVGSAAFLTGLGFYALGSSAALYNAWKNDRAQRDINEQRARAHAVVGVDLSDPTKPSRRKIAKQQLVKDPFESYVYRQLA